MDYTAIGDTINLASRMQSSASPGTVLVSGHTQRLAKDFFAFSSLGPIPVKGKEEPQEAYVLLSPTEVTTRLEPRVCRSHPLRREGKEMATLKEALDKARSGQGQVVGIVGEAGVGKSRILLEMKRLFTDMALPRGPVPPLRGLHGLPPPPRHPEIILRDQGGGAGVPRQEEDEGEGLVPR